LLLQRFGQIVCTLAQLVEESGVLDRDDGLRRKVLHQGNLLVSEWANLLPIESNATDSLALLEHRHVNNSPSACKFDKRDGPRMAIDISFLCPHVSDVIHLGIGRIQSPGALPRLQSRQVSKRRDGLARQCRHFAEALK